MFEDGRMEGLAFGVASSRVPLDGETPFGASKPLLILV